MKKLLFIIIVSVLISFQIVQVKAQTVGWTQLSFNPSQPLYSVYCLNYNTVIAVGANGYIVKTTDGGTNWNVIPSNTNNTLYKVCFVDDSTGYAVGVHGTVLKTTNYGQSWANIGLNTNLNFLSLSFINKDTGWVTGGIGDIYSPYGNKGILIKTTNGGSNWTVDSTYNKTVASVFFIDSDTGYICINNFPLSILKKTTDAGFSFLNIHKDSNTVAYYTDVFFVNAKIGYYVSSAVPDWNKDGIYKTTDYGTTWSKVLTQWSIKSLSVIDSCSYYISYADMPGSGAYGRDSCVHTYLSCPYFTGMNLINKDYGFCVGGDVYKRGIITNIKEITVDNVIKIFPNPFNDKTTVTLKLNITNSDISICVYNSIGQEIINNPLIKNNQFEIDLIGMPNGLYYLRIKDNNTTIKTEKLIKL